MMPVHTLLMITALTPGVSADTLVYSGRDGNLDVRPPRVESPRISVDARLDEPEWADAAVLTGFTQYTPVEGRQATQETEVRIFYASDAIYFGFHVFDSEPDKILVNLTERDRSSFANDWVRIMLDTFNDQRQAYTFFVNAYGIQTDGIWLESLQPLGGPTGPKVDFNPDFLWDSEGRVVDDGWVVEIRIPYVSIRFPDVPQQDWGLQIARGVTRSDFKSSWAPLTLEVSSVLAQSGRLRGIQDIQPKRLVELNPVTTAKLEGQRGVDGFSRGSVEPEVGLNARYGLTPNFVLDATLNPDFSQVEADADQIQVNERFALFFAEKRPFFLDGAEIFRSTQRLVHTRRVIDPIAGAKVTGKSGDLSVAYLGSVDESPESVFGGSGKAVFNLLRVRRDVGSGSTFGLLYTDRTVTGGSGVYNRVLSGDTRLLFGGRYTVDAQFSGSWTAAGPDSEGTGFKPFVTLGFNRTGRRFSGRARIEDVHPDFRSASGFIPRVGDVQSEVAARYDGYGSAGATLERYSLEFRYNGFYDHGEFWDGGSPYEWEVELWPRLTFRGARSLAFILRWGSFRFRAEDYAEYEVQGIGGTPLPFSTPPPLDRMLAIGLLPNVRVNDRVRINGNAFYREIPLFAEGSRGLELQLSPSLQLTLSDAWRVDLSHTWSRLWRTADDSRFSTVNLSRARVQYQFGKSVFARFIAQYDLEERDALRHPVSGLSILVDSVLQEATDRGAFQGQALVSYEPSPGTIFFVGYSRLMRGLSDYSLGSKDPIQDGFFVKVSYLFRL